MLLIADLHIHSKYAYATSKDMDLPYMAFWAKRKGIGLLGTADITHPAWFTSLSALLEPCGEGTFSYAGVKFLLNGEVSCIYRKNGKVRKVHLLVFLPTLVAAEQMNRALAPYGKLASDGRPIVKLDAEELVKIVRTIDDRSFVIPAHIWTPHFGMLGSASGFDSLDECFGSQARHIFAVETGLSSDPEMNWRIAHLDRTALISNSDAHSGPNIGREATIFSVDATENLYPAIAAILSDPGRRSGSLSTIEFFPEEGRYHFDGCRACGVRLDPAAARSTKNRCPSCGQASTMGVLHRVEDLADRAPGLRPDTAAPFSKLLQLDTIVAAALSCGKKTKKVSAVTERLIENFGSEFSVLLHAAESDLRLSAPGRVADGIMLMRQGAVDITPGYDGEYGSVALRWTA